MDTKAVLSQIEIIATGIVLNDFSPKIVFHDIKHIRRIVKAAKKIGEAEGLNSYELDVVQMGGWLVHLGLSRLGHFHKAETPPEFMMECYNQSKGIVDSLFEEHNLPMELSVEIQQLLKEAAVDYQGERSLMARVLVDAITIDFSTEKGHKRIKKLYEEMLLLGGTKMSPTGYYEMALAYLGNHEYETEHAKKKLTTQKEANYLAIEKDYKDALKQKDSALKREMGITQEELKSLKKKLKASKGRDDRGIQTMFRTTSKNHYTLNEMVDRKASIMISVNSIILSIIIGGLVGTTNIQGFGTVLPIIIMTWASFFSIIFAILSIRPDTTHGTFTKEDIRNKKGNLLFFGNFHKMKFPDYEWGVLEMLTDQDYLYSTMIRDIYYLGQTLNRKYKFLRISLNIFMVGIALSFVAFSVYRFGSSLI